MRVEGGPQPGREGIAVLEEIRGKVIDGVALRWEGRVRGGGVASFAPLGARRRESAGLGPRLNKARGHRPAGGRTRTGWSSHTFTSPFCNVGYTCGAQGTLGRRRRLRVWPAVPNGLPL